MKRILTIFTFCVLLIVLSSFSSYGATCTLPAGVEKGSNYVIGTTISTPAQHIYFELRLVDFDATNCWLIGVYTSGVARGKHAYIAMDKVVAIIEQ